MAALILVFVIELVIAFLAYFLLRKALPRNTLLALSLVASIAGLAAGWTAGYRITANTVIRDFVDKASAEQQRLRGTSLSIEQSIELSNRLQETPEYYWLIQKGAAVHALPPLLVVLLIIVPLARKQERNRKSKALDSASMRK